MAEPRRPRLYRSRSDKMLGGVSGGLADYFDVDPVLVRLAWVVLSVLSGGLFALAYLLLWIIVPMEGQDSAGRETVRQNFGEVADEARAWAGEVRQAFRPGTTESATSEPESAGSAEEDPLAGGPVTPTQTGRRERGRNLQDRHVWGGVILIVIGLILLGDNLGIIPRLNWGVM